LFNSGKLPYTKAMAHYSIKDLEKMSGIQAHTIRIWEKRYKLIIPVRTDTNIRVYSDDDLKRILNVALLNRKGLKISKIAKLTVEEMNRKIMDLSNDTLSNDVQVESLVVSMIELNESKIEKIVRDLVAERGLEETITHVIYPFLRKSGALWLTGKINPGQEHFVSNIIRRKLFAAIDGLPQPKEGSPIVVMFLPEGEYHEIGMLFYMYILRKHGYKPLYMGPSVPFRDVIETQQKLGAEYLFTAFITTLQDFSFTEYTIKLAKTFKKLKIILAGEIAANLVLKRITNVSVVRNPDDLKLYMEKQVTPPVK
jgi:MerR family transcriptional regulator, light-induced transcriptional regulator